MVNPSWILKIIIVDILAKIIKTFKYKSHEDDNINDEK